MKIRVSHGSMKHFCVIPLQYGSMENEARFWAKLGLISKGIYSLPQWSPMELACEKLSFKWEATASLHDPRHN